METLYELPSSVNMVHILLVVLSMLGMLIMSLLIIGPKIFYFIGRAGKSRRRDGKEERPLEEE